MVAKKRRIPLVRRLRYVLEFLILRILFAMFGALSLDRASAMGGFLGAKIGPHLPITRRAVANLRMVFPG